MTDTFLDFTFQRVPPSNFEDFERGDMLLRFLRQYVAESQKGAVDVLKKIKSAFECEELMPVIPQLVTILTAVNR